MFEATSEKYLLNTLHTACKSDMIASSTLRLMQLFADVLFSVINGFMVFQKFPGLREDSCLLLFSSKYIFIDFTLSFEASFRLFRYCSQSDFVLPCLKYLFRRIAL